MTVLTLTNEICHKLILLVTAIENFLERLRPI